MDGNLADLQVLEQQEVSPPCAWVSAFLPAKPFVFFVVNMLFTVFEAGTPA